MLLWPLSGRSIAQTWPTSRAVRVRIAIFTQEPRNAYW